MGIEGDKILDSEIHQLTEHVRSVKGFASGSLVLSALVQEGHDNRNTGGLPVNGCHNSLQILKMIVR